MKNYKKWLLLHKTSSNGNEICEDDALAFSEPYQQVKLWKYLNYEFPNNFAGKGMLNLLCGDLQKCVFAVLDLWLCHP